MKKIWIQVFIVIIGILLCLISYDGIKKYVNRNYIEKEIKKELVYSDIFYKSDNPYVIENSTTSTTTSTKVTTITRTSIRTTTKTTTTKKTTTTSKTTTKKVFEEQEKIEENVFKEEIVENSEKVLDNMTLKELTDKLNKSLNSNLSNTGHYFANYYVKTGLDPYLAVAIVLHETGCKWTCSKLVRECNNIGGMKGKPSCNGGNYKKFDSLEEGINGYLDMLFNNYYSKGLNTPELINPKYAASTTWSEKINNYILEIKEK